MNKTKKIPQSKYVKIKNFLIPAASVIIGWITGYFATNFNTSSRDEILPTLKKAKLSDSDFLCHNNRGVKIENFYVCDDPEKGSGFCIDIVNNSNEKMYVSYVSLIKYQSNKWFETSDLITPKIKMDITYNEFSTYKYEKDNGIILEPKSKDVEFFKTPYNIADSGAKILAYNFCIVNAKTEEEWQDEKRFFENRKQK